MSSGVTLGRISAGVFVTCGIEVNGTGYCWGYVICSLYSIVVKEMIRIYSNILLNG